MCPRERVHRASSSIAPVSVFAALHKFIVCAFGIFYKYFCNDGSPNCHDLAIMLPAQALPAASPFQPMAPTEFSGRTSDLRRKQSARKPWVSIANIEANRIDCQIALQQQVFHPRHAHQLTIFVDRQSGRLTKSPLQAAFAETKLAGKIGQREIFGVMAIDKLL
jgi:hypothetical protein